MDHPNTMRHLPPALLAGLLLITTLSGCSLLEHRDPPQPLDPQTFHHRLDQLEEHLQQQAQTHADAQRARQDALQAQMHSLQEGLAQIQRVQEERLQRAQPEPESPEPFQTGAPPQERKLTLGRVEWIGLPTIGTYLKARIDSGANSSSLSAAEISEFERNGDTWVRFKLALAKDETDLVESAREQWIEAPLVRTVRIVQASGSESRPVVTLPMSLGPIRQQVEFTLSDRSRLNYPVLIGRRFLMDIACIDVSRKFIHPRPEYPVSDGDGTHSD